MTQSRINFPYSVTPLGRYTTLCQAINQKEPDIQQLTDEELKSKASQLKHEVRLLEKSTGRRGLVNESVIISSFALIREATRRVLGLRHYDVQIIGGLALNEGKVAEMKTGEGKTIVALLPSFLNSLSGKGVHVITVNDYLARRDAETAGRVHKFLGLSVGLIQEEMDLDVRKKNYECEIVYLTNKDIGYDYLRDNLVLKSCDIVQKTLGYCIIDEIDSVLIDAAQIPLILSRTLRSPVAKYIYGTKIANALKRGLHYSIDEKTRSVRILKEGIKVCQYVLDIDDFYCTRDSWSLIVLNAIKAKELYQKNTHYILSEKKEVVIVDESTGRAMEGVRWGFGLHRSVEAKEGALIKPKSQTIASITYQNLFLLYWKLSGMTGTARSESFEFKSIYNLDCSLIPTHKSTIRIDYPDVVYMTAYLKWKAIAKECYEIHNLGRPVLVGTTSIEKSELLAALLSEYQIDYNLLNARPENVENEATIVAQAGCIKAVTISTNMAGRGTDIVLGGIANRIINEELKNVVSIFLSWLPRLFPKRKTNKILHLSVKTILDSFRLQLGILLKFEKTWFGVSANQNELLSMISCKHQITRSNLQFLLSIREKLTYVQRLVQKNEKTQVTRFGGLHVVGTERHDSSRVDQQLRGRAGRQGDPGSSRFFISFEDRLLRLFGGAKITQITNSMNLQYEAPISSTFLNQRLSSSQKKVESLYFETRKSLFAYDQAINLQRQKVYLERKKILQFSHMRGWVCEYGERLLLDVSVVAKQLENSTIRDLFKNRNAQKILGLGYQFNLINSKHQRLPKGPTKEISIKPSYDLGLLQQSYIGRPMEVPFLLRSLDDSWKDHLNKMDSLKNSIGWYAHGQLDPLLEYKKKSYGIFIGLLLQLRWTLIKSLLNLRVFFT
jgi:preprotein translocase subunit SecA